MTTYNGRRARDLIKLRGHLIEWVAQQTGYDQSYVSRMLSGGYPFTAEAARRFATCLQVPRYFFVGEIPELPENGDADDEPSVAPAIPAGSSGV